MYFQVKNIFKSNRNLTFKYLVITCFMIVFRVFQFQTSDREG
jgi:hypothetical protein